MHKVLLTIENENGVPSQLERCNRGIERRYTEQGYTVERVVVDRLLYSDQQKEVLKNVLKTKLVTDISFSTTWTYWQSTDKDVLTTFLKINHTGVPMSLEHLNFIKSIKL